MQLTMRDVSEMFKVTEATITRWVKQRQLPAQRISGRYRFNRYEVLDWAISHQIPVQDNADIHQADVQAQLSLASALEVGGIHYDVPGADQPSVLRSIVSRLPLPDDHDRELLFQLLLAREAFGSTGVGDGIAIPHARRPIVLQVPSSFVTLCFLKQPVPYQALDGKPVRILFSLISLTVTDHLQLLSRLASTLQDSRFRTCLLATKPANAILREARRLERGGHFPRGTIPRAA